MSIANVTSSMSVPARVQEQNPVMAVPPSQMMPSMPQPIFTAMTPQYVMQAAPVSVAITTPFAAASSLPQNPRFRKGNLVESLLYGVLHW